MKSFQRSKINQTHYLWTRRILVAANSFSRFLTSIFFSKGWRFPKELTTMASHLQLNHKDPPRPVSGHTNITVFRNRGKKNMHTANSYIYIWTNIIISYSIQLNMALLISKPETLCIENPKPQPSFKPLCAIQTGKATPTGERKSFLLATKASCYHFIQ